MRPEILAHSRRGRGDAHAQEMIRDRRGEGRVVAHADRFGAAARTADFGGVGRDGRVG